MSVAEPNLKGPYRMAPDELKEYKEHYRRSWRMALYLDHYRIVVCEVYEVRVLKQQVAFLVMNLSEMASLMDPTRRELNMRQERWLELLENYDTNIQYHPGKANVLVANWARMRIDSRPHATIKEAQGTTVIELLCRMLKTVNILIHSVDDTVLCGLKIGLCVLNDRGQLSRRKVNDEALVLHFTIHPAAGDSYLEIGRGGMRFPWISLLVPTTYKRRDALSFNIGDRVFLKVSPFRGVKRFGIKGKLSPRFISPFEILERIGEVSYRLALPPQFSLICLVVPKKPEFQFWIGRDEFMEETKLFPFEKILWKNHPEREATWETESLCELVIPHFSLSSFVQEYSDLIVKVSHDIFLSIFDYLCDLLHLL
ncbi:hypothetical protein Tco_0791733 [Tanacetum coccineum]